MTEDGENCLPTQANQEPQSIDHDLYSSWERDVATGWFCLANLTIAAAATPLLHNTLLLPLAWIGLFFQAAVLGIWLGVGGSSLWKRALLVAFSYYYFQFYFSSPETPNSDVGFLLVIWILLIAGLIAGLRAVLCLVMGKSGLTRFSLANLFGVTTAATIALAAWGEQGRRFLEIWLQGQREVKYIGALIFLFTSSLVTVVALPVLFRKRALRERAHHVSISCMTVGMLLLIGVSLFFFGETAGFSLVFCAVITVVALMLSCAIFPAEIALSWWKIELARPLDAERPDAVPVVLPKAEADPQGAETELP